MARKLSARTLEVLDIFFADPEASLYGLDIAERLSILSGTLYPILGRLERNGWLTSELEQVDPSEVGRPRRRFYELTGIGEEQARRAHRELQRRRQASLARPQARPGWTGEPGGTVA